MTKVEQVLAWIMERNPDLTEPPAASDDLIERRLIDSLAFLEFLYFLEELTGTEINMATIEVDDFRSVDAIRSRFLL